MNEFSFVSLIPPALVLILGYLTKRIMLSLFTGVVAAAFIVSKYNPFASIKLTTKYLLNTLEFDKFFSLTNFWDSWNPFICIFLIILGIIVTLLQHSGGIFAYGNFVRKYIKSRKGVETSSMLLSTCLFIDDYLSSLTVGSVIQPIGDNQKVPRAKLAYLIDSMAAPLAILCPFSSWVAAIIGFLKSNGISETISSQTTILGSPLAAYFNILPFLFYSFVLIPTTWFVVRTRVSFGLMKKHEDIAKKTGNLFGNGKPYVDKTTTNFSHTSENTHLIDFFAPLFILLISVIFGLLFSGDWVAFGGKRTFIFAFQNSSAAKALFLGGVISLVVCTSFFLIRKKIKFKNIFSIYKEGINLMLPAIIILLLAWTLGNILKHDLNTGRYIAHLMIGSVSIDMLPVLLFITSTAIAFLLGSSWGTAAMVFPIAIQIITSMIDVNGGIHTLENTPILFPVFGAVLSGCVAGDHISPISETTVMSSISSKTPIIDHVQTQIPYGLILVFGTGISFLLTTYFMEIMGTIPGMCISLLSGIVVSIILFKLFDKNKKNNLK